MIYLTDFQKTKIREYLRNGGYWNVSPYLLMMDYYGNVWSILESQFGSFYDITKNDFNLDTKINNYDRGDSSALRKFGGWTINKTKDNDSNILNSISLTLTSTRGYERDSNGFKPNSGADGNYWSSDDKNRFDRNANTRIFPSSIGGTGSYETPPNAIPGYYRVSRNEQSGEPRTYFPGAGFITIDRGSRNDPAFILFTLIRDKTKFADDILENNPVAVKNILDVVYGLDDIKKCLRYETPANGSCVQRLYKNTSDFSVATTDYVRDTIKRCKAKPDMCYDNVEECADLVGVSKTIDDKIVEYCVNDTSESGMGYCNDLLKSSPTTLESYLRKLCGTGENIFSNNNCRSLALNNSSLVDPAAYNKTLHENIFVDWCKDTMNVYVSGDKNWKYTNNLNDPECLTNWVYMKDGKIIESNIARTTTALDNKPWCATDMNMLQLTDEYKAMNAYWKQLGCNSDLPLAVYVQNKHNTLDIQKSNLEGGLRFIVSDKDMDRCDRYLSFHNLNLAAKIELRPKCEYLMRKSSYTNSDESYKTLNTLWKTQGCVADLPPNFYLKLSSMQLSDSQKKSNNRILTEAEQLKALDELRKTELRKYATAATAASRNTCFTGEALENGQYLVVDQCLFSQNKRYRLCMQLDGSIAIIDNASNNKVTIIQAAPKMFSGLVLIMQSDGNLVQYSGSTSLWSSKTDRNPGAFLVMRDDGRLVLYSPNGSVLKVLNQSSFSNLDIDYGGNDRNQVLLFLIFLLFVCMCVVIKKVTSQPKLHLSFPVKASY